MWFTQDGIHTHINFWSFIIIPSNKNEGIHPAATLLHFLFALSQSLSHNHRDCLQCYNTILSRITMFFFYMGNTMAKYYGSPNTMGLTLTVGQHTSQKFPSGARWLTMSPCTPQARQVYSMADQ